MSTIKKPKTLTASEIPLLIDREWVRYHVGVGTTKIIELEKAGIITPLKVPGLRNKKYRSAELLRVLGFFQDGEAAACLASLLVDSIRTRMRRGQREKYAPGLFDK